MSWEETCPRFHSYTERKDGKKILWFEKGIWDSLNVNSTGKVLINIENTPMSQVAKQATVVAVTAFEISKTEVQVDLYRLDEKDSLPINKDTYNVYSNIVQMPNYQSIITAASTSDNNNLRSFLSNFVLFIKEESPTDHWLPEPPQDVQLLIKKANKDSESS